MDVLSRGDRAACMCRFVAHVILITHEEDLSTPDAASSLRCNSFLLLLPSMTSNAKKFPYKYLNFSFLIPK